ncbi:MAG: S-layer homology domain-containing protein [Clostridia bacterium]|nr:S-layer homology domain-containing protein [Clostridia bacterium]
MKKIICLIVSVMMLAAMLMPVNAQETTVDSSISYERVKGLGLLGSDIADMSKLVTRGEFLELVSPMYFVWEEEPPSERGVIFSDVPAESKYFLPICVAYERKLISKGENPLFYPDEYITFEQASKIMLTILGYSEIASADGGYPAGYIKWAGLKGISDGVKTEAGGALTFENAIKIIDNTAHAEYLTKAGWGENTAYESNPNKTFLSEVLKIYEERTTITANPYTSLYQKTGCKPGTVKAGEAVYEAESSMYDYIGQAVRLYFKETESGEKRILYMYPDSNTKIYRVEGKDIVLSGNSIKYYDDSDKEKEVKIKDSTIFIYNNGMMAREDIPSLSLAEEILLINNDGDNSYDIVKISNYESKRISGLSASNYTVALADGTVKLDLKPEENRNISIIADGEEVDFSYLKLDDVLSVMESPYDDFKMYKIYVSRKSVDGVVEAKSDDKVWIDGEVYTLSETMQNEIVVESTGTFYIDYFGKIADTENSREMVYGYFYKVKKGTFGNVTAKIFSERSRWVEVEMAEKVNFNGTSSTPEQILSSTLLFETAGNPDSAKPQLVTYRVNDENKINELNTAVDFTNKKWSDEEKQAINDGTFRLSRKFTSNLTYRSTENTLGCEVYLTGNTFIFSLAGDYGEPINDDDISVVNSSVLVTNRNYSNIYCFDMNGVCEAKVLFICGSQKLYNNSEVFVVKGPIRMLGPDGTAHDGVAGYSQGALVNLMIADGQNVSLESGDVIQFTISNQGFAENIQKFYSCTDTVYQNKLTNGKYSHASFVNGKVQEINPETSRFLIEYEDDAVAYTFASTTSVYIYENNRTVSLKKGSTADIITGDNVFVRTNYGLAREIIIFR